MPSLEANFDALRAQGVRDPRSLLKIIKDLEPDGEFVLPDGKVLAGRGLLGQLSPSHPTPSPNAHSYPHRFRQRLAHPSPVQVLIGRDVIGQPRRGRKVVVLTRPIAATNMPCSVTMPRTPSIHLHPRANQRIRQAPS